MLNQRFGAVVSRCSVDDWLGFGKIVPEVVGVESKVDAWIGLVRNDEFREEDCVRDLTKSV